MVIYVQLFSIVLSLLCLSCAFHPFPFLFSLPFLCLGRHLFCRTTKRMGLHSAWFTYNAVHDLLWDGHLQHTRCVPMPGHSSLCQRCSSQPGECLILPFLPSDICSSICFCCYLCRVSCRSAWQYRWCDASS